MKNFKLRKRVLSALIAVGFILSGCDVEGLDNINVKTTQVTQDSSSNQTQTQPKPQQTSEKKPQVDVTNLEKKPLENGEEFAVDMMNRGEESKPQMQPHDNTKKAPQTHKRDTQTQKSSSNNDERIRDIFKSLQNSNKQENQNSKSDNLLRDKESDNRIKRDNHQAQKRESDSKKSLNNTPQNSKKESSKTTQKNLSKEPTNSNQNRDNSSKKSVIKSAENDKNNNNLKSNKKSSTKEQNSNTTNQKNSTPEKKSTAKSGVWRFIVTGDSRGGDRGINSAVLRRIRDEIIKMNPKPKFVIFTGDLVNRGSGYELSYFKRVFQKPLDDNGIKFYPIRGNHDRSAREFAKAFDYLPKNGPREDRGLTYKVTYGNSVFYFIDGAFGGGRGFARHQINWLYKNFKERGFEHRFLIAHSPLWSTGNHTPLYRGSSRALKDLITKATNVNLSTYFCGHDHFFDLSIEKASNGKAFRQFLLGTAGAPLYDQEDEIEEESDGLYHYKGYGYSVFEVDGESIKSWFVPLNGDKKIEYSYFEE